MKIKSLLSGIIFSVLFSMFIISCSKSGGTTGGTTGGSTGGGTGGGGTLAGDIGMSGSSFSPASFTVKVGAPVKWVNNDNVAHTVTSNDGTTFNSGNIAAGATYSFTPTVAGTFAYHCTLHGGMTGTLVVAP